MKYNILLIILITILFYACDDSNSNDGSNNNDQQIDTITYEANVKQVMNDFCVSCHSGSDPLGGFTLNTYQEVRNATENGTLLDRINDVNNPMPQNGLMSSELRDLIEKWAEQGYVEGEKSENRDTSEFTPPTINVVELDTDIFGFFFDMPGHWVGDVTVLGQQYGWFAFDYRPISPSHVHGIYEGGSFGNLFTSFFIADFKGTKTIMARNGGILNGTYRTSYFVLDSVDLTSPVSYYRFVDAYGGKDIMWMDLKFDDNNLHFKSYTSRLGAAGEPTIHMDFEGARMHHELGMDAANVVMYPQNIIEKDFSEGLPLPDWGDEYPLVTSYSYILPSNNQDIETLGLWSGDPYRVEQYPHIAKLKVNLEQNDLIKDQNLLLYLSMESLTNDEGELITEFGYVRTDLYDGLLSFPELSPNTDEFTFYYLHPGEYYVTVIADINGDYLASSGDVSSKSMKITIAPKEEMEISISDINIQN